MSRLLKTVFVVLVIAAFANVSQAQDDANIIRPSTKSGSAAWIFQFGGLASLGLNAATIASTDGSVGNTVAGAGLKMYIADDLAIRAILGFGTNSDGDAAKNGSNSSTTIGILAGIEMHTHDVYSTSPYFGAQIMFASIGTEHKVTAGNVDNKTSGSVFGIGVVAGFDWYFTRGIAVGGEYTLGFSSMSSSTTGGGQTVDNPSATAIGIGAASVHAIVHF